MELVMGIIHILIWFIIICLAISAVLVAVMIFETAAAWVHEWRDGNYQREFDFGGNKQFAVLMDAWNKHPMSTAGPEVDTRWFCPICGRHFPDVDGWHCPPIHYTYYHHDDDVNDLEDPLWRI